MVEKLSNSDVIWQRIQEVLSKTSEIVPRYTSEGGRQLIGTNMNRQEFLTKVVTSCIGLAVSFTITYFGFKYLGNVLDPTREEKKRAQQRAEAMLKKVGVKDAKLTEYEMCIASNLVDPSAMTTEWEDIGGMEDIIEDIKETVILPFNCQKLCSGSMLLQPPKGALLYGPPGCGKTMIARAMAKEAGARFINLSVSSLVDKWYGESQKRAEAVFSLAVKLQPAIIFIDEIDSFLRSRTSTDHEATAMIKTQFMSFWDGLMTDPKYKIMIVGATNRPQDVDAAILRRMPCMFHIGLPDHQQRENILKIILRDEVVDDVDLSVIANRTQGFSGSDLRELCRNAAIYRLRDFAKKEMKDKNEGEIVGRYLRAMTMNDLDMSLTKIQQSKMVNLIAAQSIALD